MRKEEKTNEIPIGSGLDGHICIIIGNLNSKLIKAEQQRDDLLAACRMGLKLAQMLNHPDEHHIGQAIAKAKQ